MAVWEETSEKLKTLIIISSAGTLTDKFGVKMKVRAIKVKAMAHLRIDPALADRYWLRYGAIRLQPEDRTLEEFEVELKIPEGAQLYLETVPPVVGLYSFYIAVIPK
jgi:hypothetical protein